MYITVLHTGIVMQCFFTNVFATPREVDSLMAIGALFQILVASPMKVPCDLVVMPGS